MRYGWLTDDTDDEPPCGPNLEETDPEYFNYLLTAESLLPASFFSFDRSTIDLRAETDQLAGYLKQCRDLRLLCLEAKFRILFGQTAEFLECLIGVDALLTAHWDAVYPRGEDGEYILRSGAVSTLEDLKTAILPLEYAPLVTDRRHGPITYRAQRVATGDIALREDETELDSGSILEALAKEDHNEATERLITLARDALAALTSIRSTFIDQAGYEQAPSFDGLSGTIQSILDLLQQARPDLATAEGGDGEDDETALDGDESDGGAASDTTVVTQFVTVAGVDLTNADQVRQALAAAGRYFAQREPSNPALILVHQAHNLVGKSFVDAMQVLVPGSVDYASLKVVPGKDLALSIDQMRNLSSDALSAHGDASYEDNGEGGSGMSFAAQVRPEAVALIKAAEQFYRANEPSSPIPMLLAKARKYLSLDFEVILAEMIPERESE
ncbi:MAG: type VI secretion system ImpA family N-terminal domain-containing protein [Pseudomonadota bacterium]